MADIQIDLELLTKQFETSIKKATNAADGFAKNVTGDISSINKSMKQLDNVAKNTGKSFTGSFNAASVALGTFVGGLAVDVVTKAFSVATNAVIDFSRASLQAAIASEETRSKFATVFQDISNEAQSTADNLAKSFGLGGTEARRLLGDTGDLLTGFGFAQKSALDLSKQVQELAVDLASFTNFSGGAAGASAALTKALLGERESVKALGISIQEKDVQEQVALNNANGLTFATERQAKAQATLDIALRQSKNAIGDYARTSQSAANQQRLFVTRINDIREAVGKGLVTTFRTGLLQINNFISSIDPKALTRFVSEGVVVLIEGLITLTQYVNPVINSFKFMADTFSLVFNAIKTSFNVLNVAVASFVDGFIGDIKSLIDFLPDAVVPDGWKESINNFKEATQETLEETKTSTGESVNGMLDAFDNLSKGYENSISEKGLDKIRGVLSSTKSEVEKSIKEIDGLETQSQPANKSKQLEEQNQLEIQKARELNEALKQLRIARDNELAIIEATRLESRQELDVQELQRLQNLELKKLEIIRDAQLSKLKLEQDANKRAIEERKVLNKFEIDSAKLRSKQLQEIRKKEEETDKKVNASILNSTRGFLQAGLSLAKQGSKEKKALAIADATIATYKGATDAYTQVPYPANILASASIIAQGLANVAKITSTGNFENGGLIPGSSFTGDRLTANVNSGEMILNRRQQTELFNQANGSRSNGLNVDQIRTIVAETVSNMNVTLVANDNEIARSASRGAINGVVIGVSE